MAMFTSDGVASMIDSNVLRRPMAVFLAWRRRREITASRSVSRSSAPNAFLLRRVPVRATPAPRFWSLNSRAQREELEASWREQEARLFAAVKTSIACAPDVAPPLLDAPAAAPLPHERIAPPAPLRALRGRANPRAAAAPREATVKQADHEANLVIEDRTIGNHALDDARVQPQEIGRR